MFGNDGYAMTDCKLTQNDAPYPSNLYFEPFLKHVNQALDYTKIF